MAEPKSAGLQIDAVTALTGASAGQSATEVEAGTVLRISGSGFGRNQATVRVRFDGVEVAPFHVPFSTSELVVTAPLPQEQTGTVALRVNKRRSQPVDLVVRRPAALGSAPGPLGQASGELFAALDELATMAAALSKVFSTALGGFADRALLTELAIAADAIDASRANAQRVFELWMLWLPLQADQDFEPLRQIQLMDQLAATGGYADQIRRTTAAAFGDDGPLAPLIPGGPSQLLTAAGSGAAAETARSEIGGAIERAGSSLGDQLDLAGFVFMEVVKLVEGVENFAKILKPSASAGAGVEVDASVSIGEVLSGIAKFVNILGQILVKIGALVNAQAAAADAAALRAQIDLILRHVVELKQSNTAITELIAKLGERIGEIIDRQREQGAEIDAIEGKNDELGRLLGRTLVGREWTLDPRVTRTGPNPTPDRDVKRELHDLEALLLYLLRVLIGLILDPGDPPPEEPPDPPPDDALLGSLKKIYVYDQGVFTPASSAEDRVIDVRTSAFDLSGFVDATALRPGDRLEVEVAVSVAGQPFRTFAVTTLSEPRVHAFSEIARSENRVSGDAVRVRLRQSASADGFATPVGIAYQLVVESR